MNDVMVLVDLEEEEVEEEEDVVGVEEEDVNEREELLKEIYKYGYIYRVIVLVNGDVDRMGNGF